MQERLTLCARRQVVESLQELFASIKPTAPMLVVRFSDFERFGKIPRSSDWRKAAAELAQVSNHDQVDLINISRLSGCDKLIFISHRWLRPWKTREECEENGHEWAGMPHPDDAAGSKHKLICKGVVELAKRKEWQIDQVCLWLDFCGVEQDDVPLLKAGVASLRGYISVCDAVLIPSAKVRDRVGEKTIDKIGGGYGNRAWTRLESMLFYTVSQAGS